MRHLNRDRYFLGLRPFEELRATERARADRRDRCAMSRSASGLPRSTNPSASRRSMSARERVLSVLASSCSSVRRIAAMRRFARCSKLSDSLPYSSALTAMNRAPVTHRPTASVTAAASEPGVNLRAMGLLCLNETSGERARPLVCHKNSKSSRECVF